MYPRVHKSNASAGEPDVPARIADAVTVSFLLQCSVGDIRVEKMPVPVIELILRNMIVTGPTE